MKNLAGLTLFGALTLCACSEKHDAEYYLKHPDEKDAVILGCIGSGTPNEDCKAAIQANQLEAARRDKANKVQGDAMRKALYGSTGE